MIIILTDLDGTLLDMETYSFEAAAGAVKEIVERRIPLVVISSKTRSEIESVRRDLDNHDPFVSENGGGLFVPEGYFPFPIPSTRGAKGYLITDLGLPYARLTAFLGEMKRTRSLPIRGFHALSEKEISRIAGLSIEEAVRAKEREYDEPFLFDGTVDEWRHLEQMAEAEGLALTRGGRFHHLSGPHDKGTAAHILIGWYRRWYPDALIVGLGDAANDLPFLKVVDRPVVVRRSDEASLTGVDIPGVSYTRRPGPTGWGDAVLELIRAHQSSQ